MDSTVLKTRTLNVRTTEEDYAAVQDCARFEGKSVSAFILEAIWEKLEDWEDEQAVRDYERRCASGEAELVSWEDVKRDMAP